MPQKVNQGVEKDNQGVKKDIQGVEQPLLSLLNVVTQRERDALVAGLERRGFAGAALPALRLIGEVRTGARSIQALADATGTTKQFCGREAQRLHKAGYLTLQPSPDDKRVTLVSLASRGQKLLGAVADVKSELDKAIVKKLGATDAKAFRRALERLAAEG
ncbi:MAG: MarR family transcriptional regulator [Polyangiaceae bacterium]|nr:MarR family transcriptional regulator [Polyangiaceae bacterium]